MRSRPGGAALTASLWSAVSSSSDAVDVTLMFLSLCPVQELGAEVRRSQAICPEPRKATVFLSVGPEPTDLGVSSVDA